MKWEQTVSSLKLDLNILIKGGGGVLIKLISLFYFRHRNVANPVCSFHFTQCYSVYLLEQLGWSPPFRYAYIWYPCLTEIQIYIIYFTPKMLVGKSVYSDLHVIHSSSSCLRDINNLCLWADHICIFQWCNWSFKHFF